MIMIRSPSVQTLMNELKIPLGSAQLIKQAANHGKPIAALKEADIAMNGSGVEPLYPDYPHFYYVNMGDTYDKTLYYNGTSLVIGSWGDYVERHPKNMGNFGGKPTKIGQKVRFIKESTKQKVHGLKEFMWDSMKEPMPLIGTEIGIFGRKKKIKKPKRK